MEQIISGNNTVVVVGRGGSGKTSLVNHLIRISQINRIDINELRETGDEGGNRWVYVIDDNPNPLASLEDQMLLVTHPDRSTRPLICVSLTETEGADDMCDYYITCEYVGPNGAREGFFRFSVYHHRSGEMVIYNSDYNEIQRYNVVNE